MKILKNIQQYLSQSIGWIRYTGGNPAHLVSMVEHLDDTIQLLKDLAKSYESYSAINKPKTEWDEYDYMMYPIWLRLKDWLENK